MINEKIKKCPLFTGISENQLEPLLECLTTAKTTYSKNEFIFMTDDKINSVGIVITGGVYIIQEDFLGNRTNIAHIKPVGLFGESFSCAEIGSLPVSVVAAENSEVILIDYRKIVTTCTSACSFHILLIKNMLHILAKKNIMLTQKIGHLSKRTTREKLLSFLSSEALRIKSGVIEIPFNRQDLADYLCVERSALSRELSLMQNEGLIRYDKNRFELLKNI